MTQIQIFIDEGDTHDGRPLYEYILRYLMHHAVSGATMFRGEMGFGSQHHLHAPGRFGAADEPPIMITFVDTDDVIESVLPALRSFVTDGLIIAHQVRRI